MPEAWLAEARRKFHKATLQGPLTIDKQGVPSNADKHSRSSIKIAQSILEAINRTNETISSQRPPGQASGAKFENCCEEFIRCYLNQVTHLRPGLFTVKKDGTIDEYAQYQHLASLENLARENRELSSAIGRDYLIKPDIVVVRELDEDSTINVNVSIVDEKTAIRASLRKRNHHLSILHASISCKWTLRSDRAQNA